MADTVRPASASSFGSSWVTVNNDDGLSDLDEASVSLSELSLGQPTKSRPATASSVSAAWSHELAKIATVIDQNSPPAAPSSPPQGSANNPSITALSRTDCPLTIRLHLSYDAMETIKIRSRVHKDFVQSAKPCVDCRPPRNALHFAKRMRARKESAPEIDLPLAFKNGHSALSLWTMRKQVLADDKMIKNAQVRVENQSPEEALNFLRWRKKQRKFAEKQLGLLDRKKKVEPSQQAYRKVASSPESYSHVPENQKRQKKRPVRAQTAVGRRGPPGKLRQRPMTSIGTRQLPKRPASTVGPAREPQNEGICGAAHDGDWDRDMYLKLISGDAEHL